MTTGRDEPLPGISSEAAIPESTRRKRNRTGKRFMMVVSRS
jgi:hypothetical protein